MGSLRWAATVASALLLSLPAAAQTKFRLFDQVTAKGISTSAAKGDLYYTANTSGDIAKLGIGSAGYCLVVGGGGIPQWSNICTGVVSSVGLSAPAQFTVTGSPVTSSGTLALAWQTTSQNYALMGPTSGSGTPTFRALTPGDLTMTTKGDLVGTSNGVALGRLGVGTDGWVLTADSASTLGWKWAAVGAGTVSSVALSLPGEFSISGSPVTTTGTLTGTWATQTANKFFASATTGGAATPAFRALHPYDLFTTSSAKGDLLTLSNATTFARFPVGTDGYVLSADSTQTTGLKWIAVTGTGTVTSVDMTVPTGFSVSGNPITGAGTLAVSYASVAGHKWLGNKNGTSAPPSFDTIGTGDLPSNSISSAGIVAQAPNDSTKFWRGDATWATPPGTGTVTSVDMSVPAGFAISGSPVTTTGTLAVSYATGQLQNRVLATPNGASGALSIRALVADDYPSATATVKGAVPTPPNDVTKFLRGDASWAVPPFVTSVALTAPAEITVSGSPVTSSGTLGLGWATESANRVFAGPTTGAPDVPAFRALVAADYPAFVASGASHARGAVPDPGAVAGTVKFLREDATWQVPTFSSSIEVKSDSGSPDVTGVSVMAFDHTTLSVTDNTGTIPGQVTIGCPGCTGTGSFQSKQDNYTGDGVTTVFTLTATPTTNGLIYVALNGLPQKTANYSLSGSNVTMTSAPISGASLAVGYYTALASSATHIQEDFTGSGGTDFTLAHTPVTAGILLVSLRGLVQPQTTWTMIGATTLRFASAVKTGDVVSISYLY